MDSAPVGKLARSAPYFPVHDVERSSEFYRDKLGFPIEYSAGTPMQFAICSRDGLAVMLRRVSDSDHIVPNEKQGGTWDAFFWVDGWEELYSEFKARNVEFAYHPLIQESYRMREFAVRDLDGYVLGFGEPLKD